MRELFALIKRNVKLFFKDKGMFFTSLITPLILLVLYSTLLGEVYCDAFTSSLLSDVEIPKKLSRDQKKLFESLKKTDLKESSSFDKIKKYL